LWEKTKLAKPRPIEPVIRFVAIIASEDTVRQWALRLIVRQWGDTVEVSPPLPFEAGGYYTDEMGPRLTKVMVALRDPCDPAGLADWKLATNEWEMSAMKEFPGGVVRPLNLDPGYITQAKLVLATVKDRDHRVYLHDGIFGEITLSYVAGQWIGHRWTYPDYRTEEVFEFATRCRNRLRAHLKTSGAFRTGKKNSFTETEPG
jgi:hypothetical protein